MIVRFAALGLLKQRHSTVLLVDKKRAMMAGTPLAFKLDRRLDVVVAHKDRLPVWGVLCCFRATLGFPTLPPCVLFSLSVVWPVSLDSDECRNWIAMNRGSLGWAF